MLVIIDNYDSFTYNIVQTIAANARQEGGRKISGSFATTRSPWPEIEAMRPDRLLISPGPCTPQEAGISIAAIRYFSDKLPILGVCLGHQSMGEAFGGQPCGPDGSCTARPARCTMTAVGSSPVCPTPLTACAIIR